MLLFYYTLILYIILQYIFADQRREIKKRKLLKEKPQKYIYKRNAITYSHDTFQLFLL